MMPTELITIQRYRSEYQSGVVQLILPIQNEEFGIAITAAQQPDLSDISHFYQQGRGISGWRRLVNASWAVLV